MLCVPPFPEPPGEGAHLITAISELGWAGNNGFGETVLSWAEIQAYAETTGALVEPWEFRCVRQMSLVYAAERRDDSAMRIAPYDRTDQ